VSLVDASRPDNSCLTCPPPAGNRTWRRAEDGYRICDLCLEKLGENLLDVVVRYRRLNPMPGSNADQGGRGVPGFESRSPASDHVILMRDWRSKSCEVASDGKIYVWDPKFQPRLPQGVEGPLEAPGAYVDHKEAWFDSGGRAHFEQERPPLSVPFTLSGLADLVAEDRGMSAPRGPLNDLAVWLDAQLDHVARQDWVTDFHETLMRLLGQLKPLTGDPKIRIGYCPNTIDEGEHTRECGKPLFAPTDVSKDDTIKCGGCGRSWPREEWTELGRLLQAA
jgi:hypothetical protein